MTFVRVPSPKGPVDFGFRRTGGIRGAGSLKFGAGDALSRDGLVALQRLAGNRAACELLRVQRLKGDAERYAESNDLKMGDEINVHTVFRYVNDGTKPRLHRLALLEAWNSGQTAWRIRLPDDHELRRADPSGPRKRKRGPVSEDVESSGSEEDADLSFGPSSEDEMSESSWRKRREEHSVEGKRIFKKKRVDLERFRRTTIRMDLIGDPDDYGATSLANSNFVTAKGMGDTAYKAFIPEAVKAGKGSQATADLMLRGLLDLPTFSRTVAGFKNQDDRNNLKKFLMLLFNEILGRSVSNLIDIVAILVQVKKGDTKLLQALLDHSMFIHAGGSKMSKLGSKERETKIVDLPTASQAAVAMNRRMHQSLYEHSRANDIEEFNRYLLDIVDRFAENFTEHVRVTF